jgi:hypothetical protein
MRFAAQLFTLNIVISFAFHIRAYMREPLASAIYEFFWDCFLQSLIVTLVLALFIDWFRRRQVK